MIPEMTHVQQLSESFSRESLFGENAVSNAIHSCRAHNDIILAQLIQIANQNKKLQQKITFLRGEIPPVLLNWWQSNSGKEEIPFFLKQFNKALQKQLNQLNSILRNAKPEQELFQMQLQKQVEEQQALSQRREQIINKLETLRISNREQQQDLEYIRTERLKILKIYHEQLKQLNLIKLQKDLEENNSSNHDFLRRQNEMQTQNLEYARHLRQFLEYLYEKKVRTDEVIKKSLEQLEILEKLLEKYDNQQREIASKKEEIANKNTYLSQLNDRKENAIKQRILAQQRNAELEKKYCDEELQIVLTKYQVIDDRMTKLVSRALDLAKKSIAQSQVYSLENHLNE